MEIPGISSFVHYTGVNHANSKGSASSTERVGAEPSRYELARTFRELTRLRQALAGLNRREIRGGIRRTTGPQSATAASSASFTGLGSGTASTLFSAEEINAQATSFSTFAPEWIDSTATATIGGFYDGSNGTDTLTFLVEDGGIHGFDDLKIEVQDGEGDKIETIDVDSKDAIDQVYTLENGLTVQFAAGTMRAGDTFTLGVDSSDNSYSTTSPEWAGSTAALLLDGAYNGDQGTQSLRFEVLRGGIKGVDDLKIRVYDALEDDIDTINIKSSFDPDHVFTLSNGINLKLGAGALLEGSDFHLDVFDSIGGVADILKPMNGEGLNNPALQFGLDVSDGSFQLNGTTIDVLGSQSILDILNTINSADAGVSASYDEESERIRFQQHSLGSTGKITFADDTSGFVAAMKLDTAEIDPGLDPDRQRILADVPTFDSVVSGSLRINGIAIAVEIHTDSLDDVIARINESEAGVTASLDGNGKRFVVRSDDRSQSVTLEDSGTGLLAALAVNDGTYEPSAARRSRAWPVFESRRTDCRSDRENCEELQ